MKTARHRRAVFIEQVSRRKENRRERQGRRECVASLRG
jgi:hypothetical protein